jgi:hypothetical protein
MREIMLQISPGLGHEFVKLCVVSTEHQPILDIDYLLKIFNIGHLP